jgi:hypothetical protein
MMSIVHKCPSERVRLNRAFTRIRKAGGLTQTGMCCQSCSWASVQRMKGWHDEATIAIHHAQGTMFSFPPGSGGWMQDPLHIYHDGDSEFICEALRSEGLRVEWDGDKNLAIVVHPDFVN